MLSTERTNKKVKTSAAEAKSRGPFKEAVRHAVREVTCVRLEPAPLLPSARARSRAQPLDYKGRFLDILLTGDIDFLAPKARAYRPGLGRKRHKPEPKAHV